MLPYNPPPTTTVNIGATVSCPVCIEIAALSIIDYDFF